MIIAGTYDSALVALSILTATAASYTALDLAGRIQVSSGWARNAWLATAALAMGGGIWSMHFVAMLAFSMPGIEVNYHLGLTMLSLVLPILVTGAGFFVASRRQTGPTVLGLGGFFMGLGIVGMHYTGMAAMRMSAHLSYDALWVGISVLIAIGAATVALWLAFRNTGPVQKLVAAVAMGLAIFGMHYAAMYAAIFTTQSAMVSAHGHASLGQTNLALAVSATTFLILFLALIAAMFDRRFAVLAARESAALRESEERFRALYRKTPLPLHSLDDQGTIEQVSDAWLDLMGYRREEVIGRLLINFMTEESARRRVQVDLPKLLKDGELRDEEYRLVTKAGEVLDCVFSSRVERDADGRFLYIVGGLIDVTGRKRAEEALRQSQKMEVIGTLTGGVAHDFNNLLAIVLGNLELLRKRLPRDPTFARLLDNAVQGAERGAALTQRMLAFARRQDLEPGPVDVSDLVGRIADLLQHSIGPMVRIETRFPIRLPQAHVDAHQLELALVNLVVNARDAMPDGGTVTIAAREEAVGPGEVTGLSSGHYLCLGVSDNGQGMDEATLERATEPFFTTKGAGKGTGLGLSMVQGLAEQSGGRLALRSQSGKGTIAEIWLPAAQAHENAAREPSRAPMKSSEPASEALTVLAVDDDALVLMNLAAMLEDLGHKVIEASSGTEALDLLRRSRTVDLIVTDQAMPGMTGVQLASAIKTEWPHMPIILVTGYAELPPGANHDLPKLSKPFRQEGLARAIADCMVRVRKGRGVVPFRAKLG